MIVCSAWWLYYNKKLNSLPFLFHVAFLPMRRSAGSSMRLWKRQSSTYYTWWKKAHTLVSIWCANYRKPERNSKDEYIRELESVDDEAASLSSMILQKLRIFSLKVSRGTISRIPARFCIHFALRLPTTGRYAFERNEGDSIAHVDASCGQSRINIHIVAYWYTHNLA